MTEELYIVAIVVLLPLTAWMLVVQVNPYHALVIRGILGAIAALVYALFGAADVALTEALVGTMLSITLYAVAVRSSLSMRMGVLEEATEAIAQSPLEPSTPTPSLEPIFSALRQTLTPYHMRLELVPYPNLEALQTALIAQDIHATCVLTEQQEASKVSPIADKQTPPYHLQTRVHRLYDLLQTGLPSALARLTYTQSTDFGASDRPPSKQNNPQLAQDQS